MGGHPRQVVAVLFIASALRAAAQTQDQYWPEVKLYIGLSETTRFLMKGSLDGDRNTRSREGNYSYFGEVALRPIFRRNLRERGDVFRQRYLTFGGGLQYTNSLTRNDHNREERGILEVTTRYPLPAQIVAADRSRGEFRFIHGQPFSARYRNRLWLERDLKFGRFVVTPFGYAEIFYDTRYNAWNQNRLAVGLEFPAGPHVVFQPHIVRQNNSRSNPPRVNALALTLNLYF